MSFRKPEEDDRGFIFLHIPKTGGTTLNGLLQSNYPGVRIRLMHSRLDEENFLSLPETEKKEYRILSGHFPYGLHRDLPFRSWRYLTLLRDPADRIASFYFHILRSPSDYLYKLTQEPGLSLEAFAQSRFSRELDNFQVRMLSDTMDKAFGTVTEADLEKASRILSEQMSAFGVLERFDDTVRHFSEVFNWRVLDYVPLNGGWENNMGFQMSLSTRQVIMKANALDAELYQRARKIFSKRVLKAWTRKWFIPDALKGRKTIS